MPRKPKDVTPAPAEDELGEFLDDVVSTKRAVEPLEEIDRALIPLAARLRATVADIALLPIARATPEQRTQLARLRADLDAARRDLSTWVTAIDMSFRIGSQELGANEILLDGGTVKVEPPRGEWVVNVAALREELRELRKHGVSQLSEEEERSIFKTKVEEVADNGRLNYFAKHRGGELAEAIERTRAWKPGDPAAARVTYRVPGR